MLTKLTEDSRYFLSAAEAAADHMTYQLYAEVKVGTVTGCLRSQEEDDLGRSQLFL